MRKLIYIIFFIFTIDKIKLCLSEIQNDIKCIYTDNNLTYINKTNLNIICPNIFQNEKIKIMNFTKNDINTIENICQDANYEIYNLILSHNNIEYVPENISTCIQVLRLDYNQIIVPENEPFLISQKLEALYLMNCSIQYIYVNTFENLTNLHILDITNNLLTQVHSLKFHIFPIFNFMEEICYNGTVNKKEIVKADKTDNLIIKIDNNNWECTVINNYLIYAWLSMVIFILVVIFGVFLYLYHREKNTKFEGNDYKNLILYQ